MTYDPKDWQSDTSDKARLKKRIRTAALIGFAALFATAMILYKAGLV